MGEKEKASTKLDAYAGNVNARKLSAKFIRKYFLKRAQIARMFFFTTEYSEDTEGKSSAAERVLRRFAEVNDAPKIIFINTSSESTDTRFDVKVV